MSTREDLLEPLFEVSHIEFQTYDVKLRQLICTSGLAEKVLGYSSERFVELSKDFYKAIIHPEDYKK